MKLLHIIRKTILNSLGLILLFNPSFGSSMLSSSVLRRTLIPATTYVSQAASVSALRFCSTIPEGFDIIEFNRKHKAPWLDKKQAKKEEILDISQFCADPERGILYRYQSSGNSGDKKETFPLFKTKVSTFDRCSDQSECIDVFNAKGLVESFFDLDDKSIIASESGLLSDSNTVLTAEYNHPEDSPKIKTSFKANKLNLFLRYDDGKSQNTFSRCHCTGYLLCDNYQAKRNIRDLTDRVKKRQTFLRKKPKISDKGIPCIKMRATQNDPAHHVVFVKDSFNSYNFILDGKKSKKCYKSLDEAHSAAAYELFPKSL